MILGVSSEAQPDVALLRHRDDFYANAHPTPADVLLVIEVADTSLPFDRNVKVPLYARHGMPEVRLVTLQQRRIEVFRRPTNAGYGETLRPAETEALAPLLLPEVSVNGTDLWRWSPRSAFPSTDTASVRLPGVSQEGLAGRGATTGNRTPRKP